MPSSVPASVCPVRVTRSTPIGERSDDVYLTQWFTDVAAAAAYEAWAKELADTPVVVAEEVVQRGGGWLERRWAGGGNKWKHVALARRAKGLSQAEFSQRWRGHAGKATTKAAVAMPVPEAARGLAYVQNHPLIGVEWPFDAITEVWFENPESMQSRIEWFRDNLATDDLFGETTFLTVMEDVLDPMALS